MLAIALAFPAFSLAPRACAAQQSDSRQASQVLKMVDAHYNHLSSLRCTFVEHFAGLGAERTESGTLLLSKPGRMRWTYAQPAGKLFVLDGHFAWFYTPGAAQVQRVPAKQLDDLRSPLRYLLGHTQLQRELGGVSVTAQESGYQIRGVPKDMEQRLAELRLDVSAKGTIEAIRAEERDGSITEFQFRDMAEDVALPADTFRFHTPEGVGVVDALPPI